MILPPDIVNGTRAKLVSIRNKTCFQSISMLTGFKVSLASKYVQVVGMQRWDKSKDRAQRVDEKIGVKMFKKNSKNHVYFH